MASHLKHSSLRASAAAALLAALSLIGGCGGGGGGTEVSTPASTPPAPTSAELPPAVAQAQSSQTFVSPSIVAADNTLGLNLFKILDQGSTANVAISPTSIALVLQILYNGAAGSTQQAMSEALQLQGLTVSDVNSDNAALQAALVNPDPEIALTVANSLWMHLSGNSVLPSFTQVNETYYGAEVGDLSGAPANVNAWISNETDGLITTILPAGNYSSDVAVVVNALYFKGAWTQPFDPNETSAAPFTQLDGTTVSCPMMHLTGTFDYFTGATFQAARLPYGTNSRMSMVILLPNSGVSLGDLIGSITPQALDGWISELQPMTGAVALPRFTAIYGASLPGALSTLGMGIAFSPNGADFSGIAPGIYLSDVEHKTVVEVDENGTVAAAGTSGSTTTTAAPTPQFQITMDHPFFYAIRDDEIGALLFIGAMVVPGQ